MAILNSKEMSEDFEETYNFFLSFKDVYRLLLIFSRIVRQLLQREPELANLPSTENLKQTPLHLACSHGDLPIVNELLETVRKL